MIRSGDCIYLAEMKDPLMIIPTLLEMEACLSPSLPFKYTP